jgi:hypothetical protein
MGNPHLLGLAVRPGWLVREQVECAPPDGSFHVTAFSEPVPEGATTHAFAAGYGQLFAEHLPGYEEIDVREVRLFGGRPAILRRYRHVPADGAPLTRIAAYLVEGSTGHVAVATTTTSRFSEIEGDLLGLLAQIDLDRSTTADQSGAAGAPGGQSATSPTLSSTPWRDGGKKAKAAKVVTVAEVTADELIALAHLFRHDRFPYLDETDSADAMGEAGAPVRRAALRSLGARGLLARGPDGSLVPADGLAKAVEVALDPPLVVSVEVEGGAPELVAMAVDDERCVEVVRRGGGVYTVREGAAAGLIDRVATLTGAVDAGTSDKGAAAVVPAIAVDRARAFARTGDPDGAARELAGHPDLLQALLDATHVCRVRAVHRSGDALHGGELLWLQTSDGRAWVMEPQAEGERSDPTVQVRPIGRDDLYAELLSLLP